MQLRWPARTILAPLTVLAVVAGTAPALATAKPVASHVSAHLAPSTAHTGSVVAIAGATTPRITSSPVTLERLVGSSWRVLGHSRTSRTGTYAFALRAPGKPAGWTLRVVRSAYKTALPAASARVHLSVVTAVYVVSAVVTATTTTQPVVVTGTVRPKASGSVELQVMHGRTWVNLATGKLTKTSSYAISVTRVAGSYRLRVVKAFSAKVAGGTGKAVTATVTAPPVAPPVVTAPVITTTALTGAMVGRPYSLTLTATGGSAPYAWTAAGLPAGLVLSAAGVLSGTPTTVGASTVAVKVTDSQARTATASLPLAVAVLSGTVRVWGSGTSGQLGNNTLADSSTPVSPTGLTLVTALASGTYSNYALRTDGTVWSWGSNYTGQLGIGDTTDSRVPVQVPGLAGVTALAAGEESAYALKSDGTVWAWGDDTDGELGNGAAETPTPVTSPVQVSGLTGIVAITATDSNGLALKSDGTVYAWGSHTTAVLGNGGAVADVTTPAKINSLAGVTAIAGGGDFALALVGGAVKAWGDNTHGALGIGSTASASQVPVAVGTLTGITAISAGYFDGYALHANGTLSSWGYNNPGQLGTGVGANALSPVAVTGLTGVTAIEGRASDCSALLADGSVLDWGDNTNGGLGNGNVTTSPTPVPVVGLPTVVALASGGDAQDGAAIIATQ